MSDDAKKPLGRILLKQRAISQPALERALADPRRSMSPLATRLTESGVLTEVAALKALSEQSGVPGMDLAQVLIRTADLSILPREVATRRQILPVLVRDDRIFVAMVSPTQKKIIEELEFVTGKRVFPYIALAGAIAKVTQAAYDARDRGEPFYVGPSCPPDAIERAKREHNVEPEPLPLPSRAPAGFSVPAASRAPAPQASRAPDATSMSPARFAPSAASSAQIADETSFAEVSMQPPSIATRSSHAPASSPVVVDDDMNRVAASEEVQESDLGGDRISAIPAFDVAPKPRADARTILVVDDELEIRVLIRRVLEERGYHVVEADRGYTALAMLKDAPPELVILDAMLPEVHGFDIAKRMKGSDRFGHIPIIMVSAVYRGWRFAEDVKASYGVDAYLEKPFAVSELLVAVESAFARRDADSRKAMASDADRELKAGIDAYKRGDVNAAIQHLQRGVKIDPLAYRLHFHLGLLFGKHGRLYDAIQSLETALQINATSFPALKNLAVLYQQAGFRNKAVETWERALPVAPDEPTRRSIKEHLLGLL
jgi:DNA-binding response OmpR family regulator